MTTKNLQTITQKSYDRIARQFSKSRKYVWSDLAIFLAYIKDGDKVLDLGCGSGRLISLLKPKKIDYLGVDFSRELIKQAKANYPDRKFKVGNALTMKFNHQFDVIISAAVFNHMPDDASRRLFLRHVSLALKPGGYFLMSNWNLWNDKNKKGVNFFTKIKQQLSGEEFLQKFGVKKTDLARGDVLTEWGQDDILYYYAFTPPELKRLLEQTKFKPLKNYYSFDGQRSTKFKGRNIITIAQKKKSGI
ncbi:TPA: hypothetical protein DF272_02585 [Candidatus Falkowbacteria bacterium]|nr:hypothetical protein [Candidatus Falkowbacteria bacterium]